MSSQARQNRLQFLLAMALLGTLILFTFFQRTPEQARAFELTSAAPNGLLALQLWLQELGYTQSEISGTTFGIPASTALIVVPPTNVPYTEDEAAQLANWVAAGGTAILIGPNPRDDNLRSTFGVHPGQATPLLATSRQRQLLAPVVGEIDLSGAYATLDLTDAPAAMPIMATDDGQVTAAVQPYGEGTVWHLNRHHSFINEQLRDPAQATLVLMILENLPQGSTIQFDTYHLWGASEGAQAVVGTLQEWLYYTTWGWALLFAMAISALFLLLQGRRLGPALPAQAELRRREAAEYVIAMANLRRRARHRSVVAEHFRRRLKRKVGHRAQIDARLSDTAFVEQLATHETELPAGTAPNENGSKAANVARLLQNLEQATNDQELIETVAEIDQLT